MLAYKEVVQSRWGSGEHSWEVVCFVASLWADPSRCCPWHHQFFVQEYYKIAIKQ